MVHTRRNLIEVCNSIFVLNFGLQVYVVLRIEGRQQAHLKGKTVKCFGSRRLIVN